MRALSAEELSALAHEAERTIRNIERTQGRLAATPLSLWDHYTRAPAHGLDFDTVDAVVEKVEAARAKQGDDPVLMGGDVHTLNGLSGYLADAVKLVRPLRGRK